MADPQESNFEWESEEERILKGMRIPPEEKLRWLREINEFTEKALTQKQKEIRRNLRTQQ